MAILAADAVFVQIVHEALFPLDTTDFALVLGDGTLSDFTRKAEFPTVMGALAVGARGGWPHPRVLQVVAQGIDGHGLDQCRDGALQLVMAPQGMTSGSLIYPFADARTT